MDNKYLEMTYVKETASGRGHNDVISIEDLGNGNMKITEGRIGVRVGRYKPHSYVRPVEEWDDFVKGRQDRGYLITKTKKMDRLTVTKQEGEYAPIEDLSVRELVEGLQGATRQLMEESYSMSMEDISEEMIALGKETVDWLATNYETASVEAFNNKLKTLYSAIPRKMDNILKHLVKSKNDMRDKAAEEQELFDIMIDAVKNAHEGKPQIARQTILEAKGIEIRPVTADEKKEILAKLGGNANQYLEAWRVENHMTRDRFEKFCEKENLTPGHGIDTLFHGSRNENFWSIITNGLTINPVGVVITGKAYGNGTYFAPAACKSLGYTSRWGSRWANGTENFGFLGIYEVATGKRYDGHHGCDGSLCWEKLQKLCPGAHCTWAEARWSGFMMDEVIVYQDCQSTVKYLVKFKP